jgi:hypothetical protein
MSTAWYIRQTFVLNGLAELFPVPSDNKTMFLGIEVFQSGLLCDTPLVEADLTGTRAMQTDLGSGDARDGCNSC